MSRFSRSSWTAVLLALVGATPAARALGAHGVRHPRRHRRGDHRRGAGAGGGHRRLGAIDALGTNALIVQPRPVLEERAPRRRQAVPARRERRQRAPRRGAGASNERRR